jgi:hypothetical protein
MRHLLLAELVQPNHMYLVRLAETSTGEQGQLHAQKDARLHDGYFLGP